MDLKPREFYNNKFHDKLLAWQSNIKIGTTTKDQRMNFNGL